MRMPGHLSMRCRPVPPLQCSALPFKLFERGGLTEVNWSFYRGPRRCQRFACLLPFGRRGRRGRGADVHGEGHAQAAGRALPAAPSAIALVPVCPSWRRTVATLVTRAGATASCIVAQCKPPHLCWRPPRVALVGVTPRRLWSAARTMRRSGGPGHTSIRRLLGVCSPPAQPLRPPYCPRLGCRMRRAVIRYRVRRRITAAATAARCRGRLAR
jgi:hypothetical protein